MAQPSLPEKVNLPVKPFLYTIDQIASLLNVSEQTVRTNYLHYENRSPGVCPKTKLKAVNIAPDPEVAVEWRVTERSLANWLRFRGIRLTRQGWL